MFSENGEPEERLSDWLLPIGTSAFLERSERERTSEAEIQEHSLLNRDHEAVVLG